VTKLEFQPGANSNPSVDSEPTFNPYNLSTDEFESSGPKNAPEEKQKAMSKASKIYSAERQQA